MLVVYYEKEGKKRLGVRKKMTQRAKGKRHKEEKGKKKRARGRKGHIVRSRPRCCSSAYQHLAKLCHL